jgi:hypothetical protein
VATQLPAQLHLQVLESHPGALQTAAVQSNAPQTPARHRYLVVAPPPTGIHAAAGTPATAATHKKGRQLQLQLQLQ